MFYEATATFKYTGENAIQTRECAENRMKEHVEDKASRFCMSVFDVSDFDIKEYEHIKKAIVNGDFAELKDVYRQANCQISVNYIVYDDTSYDSALDVACKAIHSVFCEAVISNLRIEAIDEDSDLKQVRGYWRFNDDGTVCKRDLAVMPGKLRLLGSMAGRAATL